jgi:hypothetical protein
MVLKLGDACVLYVLQGRYKEARRVFDRLLSRCNDVGLLGEEFDPLTGRMLGNFRRPIFMWGRSTVRSI